MKRLAVASALVLTACVSAAAGYWLGVRDGWKTGVAADFVPRGVIAAQQLGWLRAGTQEAVVIGLEHDVDQGLIWAHDVFQHPMRELWWPVWRIDVYPTYEEYATRLANYRKERPSSMSATLFDEVPADKPELRAFYKDLSVGAREAKAKLDHMITRYATKK